MRRIVFDIETEPFSKDFKEAESARARAKFAPRMRLACAFDESSEAYRYFGPKGGRALSKLLQSADEVVSFNGKNFDLAVLRKHYGMKGRVPLKGKHIDLYEIMTTEAGFRVSLDAAVRLNLGERKHTDGRKMDALEPHDLRVACESDVRQTYQLFLRHRNGTLTIPAKTRGRWNSGEERSYSDAPHECTSCHALNCLEEVEWEMDQMSEGQLADYLAGVYGSAECRACGEVVDWGF